MRNIFAAPRDTTHLLRIEQIRHTRHRLRLDVVFGAGHVGQDVGGEGKVVDAQRRRQVDFLLGAGQEEFCVDDLGARDQIGPRDRRRAVDERLDRLALGRRPPRPIAGLVVERRGRPLRVQRLQRRGEVRAVRGRVVGGRGRALRMPRVVRPERLPRLLLVDRRARRSGERHRQGVRGRLIVHLVPHLLIVALARPLSRDAVDIVDNAAATARVVVVLRPVLAHRAAALADVLEVGAAEVLVLLDVEPEVERVLLGRSACMASVGRTAPSRCSQR